MSQTNDIRPPNQECHLNSPTAQVITVRFVNTHADFERAMDEMEGQIGDIAPEMCVAVRLVMEEMGTNIIKYGYDDQESHCVTASFRCGPPAEFSIEDDGHPFNPLVDAPLPGINDPIEARKIGGLGVHMVKKMTATQAYVRTADGRNCFSVTFHPPEEAE